APLLNDVGIGGRWTTYRPLLKIYRNWLSRAFYIRCTPHELESGKTKRPWAALDPTSAFDARE
ncbi:hypothetical protein, partial [Ruegeria sp.]|uniref:hypothetical protein n=1 Tax=Ruegeria sp. TaxID=1879320 RepID=UPI0023243633